MKRLLRILAAVAVAAVILLMLQTHVLSLRSVEVSGGDAQAVIAASDAKPGTFLLTLDEEKLRAGVNSLGTLELEQAEIHLPGVLRLRVRERERAAMLLCGERIAVVDWGGAVVELLDEAPDRDMIYLSGIEARSAVPGRIVDIGDEAALDLCRAALAAVRQSGAGAYISEIHFADGAQLALITRDAARALLGDGENLQQKLSWMRAAAQDLLLRGESGGTLDLSIPGRADYRPADFE